MRLSTAITLVVSLAGHSQESLSPITRSDVVFPYTSSAEVYRQYGATLVAWGFRPWNAQGEELTAQWRAARDLAHSVGARYQARVELDAGWKGWIDFADDPTDSICRSLEGKPLTYRAWTRTYKGHPAYQGCTNAPEYREYLRHQAREALSSQPDMLLLDAIQVTPMTTWRGGCFCRYCVEGFREYIRDNVPGETLAEQGLDDLATFDYGAFLRGRGVTDGQFGKLATWWPPKLPLAQEYLTFQHLAARAFLADFRRRVEAMAGRGIPLSTSSALQRPRDWWAYPVVDHYTVETMFRAKERAIPEEPIFRYRLADALGTPLLATGVPQWDFTFVRDHKLPGLVRTWIAQAYAYGHHFMVPHSMWCGEGDKARYESEPGDCDDLYRFVRRHAELFDGYEPVASVGLLYSNTAFRRHQQQARQACYELTRRNIPFRLVVAGDEWMPRALEVDDLADLKALVVTQPLIIDPTQQETLARVQEKTVDSSDAKRLTALAPPQVTLAGATNVTVLPRAKPNDPGAPFVCHLLNGNYVADSDSMQTQREFDVTLSASLFGTVPSQATLLAPGKAAVECVVHRSKDGARIEVPELDVWAVLKLETET